MAVGGSKWAVDLCSCVSTCPGMLAVRAICAASTDETLAVVSAAGCVCKLPCTLPAVSAMTGLTPAGDADALAGSLTTLLPTAGTA